MNAVDTFKSNLNNWFVKNGFDNLPINFTEDFGYAIFEDGQVCINIGVQAYPEVGRYFEQFLYEYGLEYCGIYDPVLCLLHELGHHMTYRYFNDNEQVLYRLAKEFDHGEDQFTWLYRYWSIPDEFAANMWAINFVNNHIDAVEELCEIYTIDWTAMCEEVDMWSLIQEAV